VVGRGHGGGGRAHFIVGQVAAQMTSYVFEIPGEPIAKGRPRYTSRGHFYTPAKTRRHEAYIQDIISLEMKRLGINKPFIEALRVDMIALFSIPASWPVWKRNAALAGNVSHTSKPDIDNVLKLCVDAASILFRDDSQVIDGRFLKMYAKTPVTWLTITPIAGLTSQTKKKP
jgi:Holliday junction resolvase RusA-like endonuclease|tara:strand:- start:278 stop:793 length:516 start_codon:yes stop_codon:yes gene_type:complete